MIGPSGAGKTSFVRAGVIASRPEGWAAVRVHARARTPFRAWRQALAPELAGDAEALRELLRASTSPDSGGRSLVARAGARGHGEALLVVDQFEELFTLNPPEVAGALRRPSRAPGLRGGRARRCCRCGTTS